MEKETPLSEKEDAILTALLVRLYNTSTVRVVRDHAKGLVDWKTLH